MILHRAPHPTVESMSCLVAVVLSLCLTTLALGRKSQCFDELGCFPVTAEFLQRPINLQIAPREAIGTKYFFYSRENPTEAPGIIGHLIKDGNILRTTTFSAKRPTKMVVHGWLDNILIANWMAKLKDALLRHGDYNVILVDWTGGNGLPYTRAAVNARLVGAEIGLLVKKLQAVFGIPPSSVHVYGHSLGGHVAGYAGKWLNGTLGRITSLDPAEPYFQDMPPSVRVASDDALFVEVVHSDGRSFVTRFGLGMSQAVGQVDFYPNGGEFMPGCSLTDRIIEVREKELGVVESMRKIVGCNHMRAIDYTIDFLDSESTGSQCHPVAFACPSYELFNGGHCADCGADGSRCAIMSLDGAEYFAKHRSNSTNKTPLKMYYKTSTRQPFCLYHYSINLKLHRDVTEKKPRPVSGRLQLKLDFSNDTGTVINLHHERSKNTFIPGSVYRYLITSPTPLSRINSMRFSYRSGQLFRAPKFYLDYVRITPMTVADIRTNMVKLAQTFCAKQKAISSGSETLLSESFCAKL